MLCARCKNVDRSNTTSDMKVTSSQIPVHCIEYKKTNTTIMAFLYPRLARNYTSSYQGDRCLHSYQTPLTKLGKEIFTQNNAFIKKINNNQLYYTFIQYSLTRSFPIVQVSPSKAGARRYLLLRVSSSLSTLVASLPSSLIPRLEASTRGKSTLVTSLPSPRVSRTEAA